MIAAFFSEIVVYIFLALFFSCFVSVVNILRCDCYDINNNSTIISFIITFFIIIMISIFSLNIKHNKNSNKKIIVYDFSSKLTTEIKADYIESQRDNSIEYWVDGKKNYVIIQNGFIETKNN